MSKYFYIYVIVIGLSQSAFAQILHPYDEGAQEAKASLTHLVGYASPVALGLGFARSPFLKVSDSVEKEFCIKKSLCVPDDFKATSVPFRADEFMKRCAKISESNAERSPDAIGCYSFFFGTMTALNMESFHVAKLGQSPEFCIEGSVDSWISRFIIYLKQNPELGEKRIDFALRKFFSSESPCRKENGK